MGGRDEDISLCPVDRLHSVHVLLNIIHDSMALKTHRRKSMRDNRFIEFMVDLAHRFVVVKWVLVVFCLLTIAVGLFIGFVTTGRLPERIG